MFKILLTSKAEKFYLSSKDSLASKLNRAFDEICLQPFIGKNIKKLKGSLNGMYRYRIGNYRIVYEVDNSIKIVSIVWIGKRKEAY